MANLDDSIRRIEGMIEDFRQLPFKIELYAANQAKAIILIRIFSKGQDADGKQIGTYKGGKKAYYKSKRNKAGRRVDTVDLQFTGKLFESIDVVNENGKPRLAIADANRSNVANHLEVKYGKDIFTIKGVELEQLMAKVTLYATEQFNKIIAKWSQE